jgi:hypothetical protein
MRPFIILSDRERKTLLWLCGRGSLPVEFYDALILSDGENRNPLSIDTPRKWIVIGGAEELLVNSRHEDPGNYLSKLHPDSSLYKKVRSLEGSFIIRWWRSFINSTPRTMDGWSEIERL